MFDSAFSVFNSVTNFVMDAGTKAFAKVFDGDSGDPRNESNPYARSYPERKLGLADKYGGFLSNALDAYKVAAGQKKGVTPFSTTDDDLKAPRVNLGSSRAALPSQVAPLGGIRSPRLSLAVQTAMRRATQSNADFQRLLSQQTTSPRMVRGRRTLGLESSRMSKVQSIRPADVRKESK